jgi:hypothetical protein
VLLLWMCATSNFQEFEHHPDPRTAPPSCLGHCHAAPPLPIAPAWLRTASTLASVPLITILQMHTSIESRLSQTCTAHGTRSSAFRLGHLKVLDPWRRALPSYPYADATSRSAPPIFAPNCALSCSGRSRGARDTPRRGRLAAAIASITCRKVGLGRVSHGAALCGSQVASRPYTSTLRIKVSV